MGDNGDVWSAALAEARLSSEERGVLTHAHDEDAELGVELTWLVAHLRADLSGEFLRAMVDNLRTGLEPELCVIRSLREAVAASAALIDLGRGDA